MISSHVKQLLNILLWVGQVEKNVCYFNQYIVRGAIKTQDVTVNVDSTLGSVWGFWIPTLLMWQFEKNWSFYNKRIKAKDIHTETSKSTFVTHLFGEIEHHGSIHEREPSNGNQSPRPNLVDRANLPFLFSFCHGRTLR